jgi:hypothetical protein
MLRGNECATIADPTTATAQKIPIRRNRFSYWIWNRALIQPEAPATIAFGFAGGVSGCVTNPKS